MKPVYKKVKVAKAHCPVCKEQLDGNDSILSPLFCECGQWRYNMVEGEYEVITKNK